MEGALRVHAERLHGRVGVGGWYVTPPPQTYDVVCRRYGREPPPLATGKSSEVTLPSLCFRSLTDVHCHRNGAPDAQFYNIHWCAAPPAVEVR